MPCGFRRDYRLMAKNPTEELRTRNQLAENAGGEQRKARQHQQGKLTARQRVHALLDPNSFVEVGKFVENKDPSSSSPGDGVITGFGTINSKPVYIFSQDFTVAGGSLSGANAQKICKIIIGLNDSGGARIQEGVESLGGYADIFLRNTLTSGIVPQISLILGPCAGGAVYSPAITDFIFMVDNISHMFITGPEVIKSVTREDVTKDELGGARTHHEKSGVCHFVSATEAETFTAVRHLLTFIPQNNREKSIRYKSKDSSARLTPELESMIPSASNRPYDMLNVIKAVVDNGELFESQAGFARNIVTGFARLNGHSIGVVANNPQVLAGCLDINASSKAARFVRFCDAFQIPLLTFVDVPGFLPGTRQEFGGIIRHGAKLLYAFAEATVPKLTVIVRKAYGGAYDVMSSKHIRGDFNIAYPGSEVAVMGPEAAVKILNRAELKDAADPVAKEKELIEAHRENHSNPWRAAALGYLDTVIEPKDTRSILCQALESLQNKKQTNPWRKHGNIPL